MAALGGLAGTVLESSPWWCSYERAATLTSSDTNQAQIQGSGMAQPNIYPINELLEYMKGPVLQIQNHRISMTQGNDRVS